MVDLQTVCCMCGDVGFPDKLFRCNKCRYRYQHSYCSNYYMTEYAEPIEECDWCQSEGKGYNHRQGKKSGAGTGMESGASSRPEYGGDKIKQPHMAAAAADQTGPTTAADQKAASKSSPSGGAPSPRQSTRRYKLLKDVMC